MLTRVGAFLVVAGCFAGLLGCVSADVYRVKEQEVQTLYRANDDVKEQNRLLLASKTELEIQAKEMKKENEGLKGWLEKQNEQIVYLKNRVEALEKDGEGLRERGMKLDAKIAELNKENQRLAVLSRPENLLRGLGERLADLQKQVEALSGENEKLKSKQVIARSEEEKSGVAQGEKTIEPAGGKVQAVLVSDVQKVEDSKPVQQLQEEREQPALSEGRDKP
jgi:hypothetical protein